MQTKKRLNKAIAEFGEYSRRKADELIDQGLVLVNGKIGIKGQSVTDSDKLEVRGRKLLKQASLTIMLNKPAGLLSTKSDPHNKNTVMTLLPPELQHLKPAGRLDKDSEGLLILSSDGDLIQKLTHPKNEHTKTYEILVKGHAKEQNLLSLRSGQMVLDGYKLNPIEFKILGTLKAGKTKIKLILTEGRKRQIRRVMDKLGFPVIYLRRTAIGNLELEYVESGSYKELTDADIAKALSLSPLKKGIQI